MCCVWILAFFGPWHVVTRRKVAIRSCVQLQFFLPPLSFNTEMRIWFALNFISSTIFPNAPTFDQLHSFQLSAHNSTGDRLQMHAWLLVRAFVLIPTPFRTAGCTCATSTNFNPATNICSISRIIVVIAYIKLIITYPHSAGGSLRHPNYVAIVHHSFQTGSWIDFMQGYAGMTSGPF